MKNYRLVYLDPPWSYNNWTKKDQENYTLIKTRAMGRPHYPVFDTQDIAKIPVPDIMSRHSVMAMWATSPKMDEAVWLMKYWGFSFKTIGFTWVKLNPSGRGWFAGQGFYTRQNAEYVLVGRKGAGVARQAMDVRQIVIYPVGRHSAKPPTVRDRLVRLFGDVSRIELFAREKPEGWDAWGNEAPEIPDFPLNEYMVPPVSAILDERKFADPAEQEPTNHDYNYDIAAWGYEHGEQMILI